MLNFNFQSSFTWKGLFKKDGDDGEEDDDDEIPLSEIWLAKVQRPG